jgi:hypothetical protein
MLISESESEVREQIRQFVICCFRPFFRDMIVFHDSPASDSGCRAQTRIQVWGILNIRRTMEADAFTFP